MAIIFVTGEWMDVLLEFRYPYWTNEMNMETDNPLYIESIPKLGDPNYPHVRIM